MDEWFGMTWFKHGKSIIGILAASLVLGLGFFVVNNELNNTNNPRMYEDEMIVSIDDYEVLQDTVITLQEAVNLLLDQEAKRIKEG